MTRVDKRLAIIEAATILLFSAGALRIAITLLFAFIWSPLSHLTGAHRTTEVPNVAIQIVLALLLVFFAILARLKRGWARIAVIVVALTAFAGPSSAVDWIPVVFEVIGGLLFLWPSPRAFYSARGAR